MVTHEFPVCQGWDVKLQHDQGITHQSGDGLAQLKLKLTETHRKDVVFL